MARIIVYLKDCSMADVSKLMQEIAKNKIVDEVAHVTEEEARLTKRAADFSQRDGMKIVNRDPSAPWKPSGDYDTKSR